MNIFQVTAFLFPQPQSLHSLFPQLTTDPTYEMSPAIRGVVISLDDFNYSRKGGVRDRMKLCEG